MRVVINGIEQQVNLAGLQKIGRGGEGDVYLLIFGGKKYALKLYFRPSEEKHLKIKTMIQNCPHDAIANINGIEFTDKSDTKTYMSRNEYIKKFSK